MKTPYSIGACAIVCCLSAPPAGADTAPGQQPDSLRRETNLILTNGQIRTPTGWAEAIAIRDGVITAVGYAADIDRLRTPATTVIDLKGETVLPGLSDMHVHVTSAGLEQFACRIKPGSGPAEIAATVKACVSEKKPGQWVTGGSWVAAGFNPGQQNRQFLDALSPANPVMLGDEAHHSVWVNSAALKLAGVTRDTPDPPGGVIERDAAGEPTGLLRETALMLVAKAVPPPTEAEKRGAIILAANQMLSYGITSYTDAGVVASDIAAMSQLSGAGLLKQRVRGCIRWMPLVPGGPAFNGEALIEARAAYTKPRLKLDCVKIVLDGVPTESHTAVMLEPYLGGGGNDHDDTRARGLPMIPAATLFPAVIKYDRAGLTVKFHAAGDGAVREAIDAVAAARRANGWGGPSHDIAHNSFVDPADIPRVRDLHMTWEFSPYIWYPTPIAAHDIRVAVGDERMKRWIPIKDAVDTGAGVVAGSDWSVVPSVNPWLAIETMVTRQMPGGSKETLGEGQKVTLEQAFRIFTENAADHMGDRNLVGSIEPGLHADLVVVAQNPFKVPITQVHATRVEMTFIDGEKVYDAASPPKLTAR